MRPLTLTIRALGPFPEEVRLDFSELGGRNFFLINGPTGAGKTTILDAICLALYGAASGDERDVRQMRSQHARPETSTEVSLDFSLGEKKYRIWRAPEQERPKKRGEGLTRDPAQAAIWDRTGLDDEAQEGVLLADRWSSATDEVVRRLGFQAEQFRQVILLPQGRFRKLLLADSKERQEILETLFQTGFYRQVEEELKEAAQALTVSLKEAASRESLLLGQAGVESRDGLSEKLTRVRAGLSRARTDSQSLRQVDSEARKVLARAEQDLVLINERNQACRELENLEKQLPQIQAKTDRLAAARRAREVGLVEKPLIQKKEEAGRAAKRLSDLEGDLARKEKHKREAEEILKKEEGRGREREDAAGLLTRLRDMLPKVENFEILKRDRDSAARQAQRLGAEVKRIREDLAGREKDLTEASSRLTRLVRSADAAEGLAREIRNLQKFGEGFTRLERIEKDLADVLARERKAKDRLTRLNEELTDTRRDLDQALAAWREGQAGRLARDLEPDRPCPVCGSTQHPDPAPLAEDFPEEEDLRAYRRKLDKLEKEIEGVRLTLNREQGSAAGLKAEKKSREADLGQWLDQGAGALKRRLAELEQEKSRADAAGRMVVEHERMIKNLEKDLAAQKSALDRAEKEFSQAEARRVRAETLYQERQEAVPEQWRTTAALKKELNQAQDLSRSLEESLTLARKRLSEADRKEAETGAARRAAAEHLQNLRRDQAALEEDFGRAVTEAGFADPDEYRLAWMSDQETQALEDELNDFQRTLQTARDRSDRACRAAGPDLVPPDIKALTARADQARSDLENAVREESRLEEEAKGLEKLSEALAETDRKSSDLHRRYAVVGRLAETASGKNEFKLTFQRFVLGALLDDALLAATTRLEIMSGGRYRLERAVSQGDRRVPWGLDLQVHDEYTGRSRPASTLSGGESFLAALSLALGLADVVQAYSGGVHLDAIFVDEGFGSLDPEALDLALRALQDLQQGGRMVGLISHVPELKERIDARLEVESGRSGSRARFLTD